MDELGGEAVVYFFAQIADVDIHYVGAAFVIVIPYMLFYFFTGQDNALIADRSC